MLKKDNRIRLNKEFDRVFKAGQSFYGKFLGVKIATNDLGLIRVGIMVSTKVSKKAVVRNLAKRRIRSVMSGLLDSLKPGYDIVIIALPSLADQEFPAIKSFLEQAMVRLRLYTTEKRN
jgi:ribonuclease P protein component